MSRDPRAATTLIRELRAVVPDIDAEADDRDGFGVYRTFRLTSKDYKGLPDVITAVADERIVQSRSIANGVEVTITHQARLADLTREFGVSHASDLISKRRAKKAVTPKPE